MFCLIVWNTWVDKQKVNILKIFYNYFTLLGPRVDNVIGNSRDS